MTATSANLPVITVITVVFNGVEQIEGTIKSVLDQPYGNLKYIVIDGGSTDGTVDIIKRYGNRITYWTSEKDSGIYDAMNKGWALADAGSFILFIGAGDRLIHLPQHMHRYSTSDVIYGRVRLGDTLMFIPSAGFRLKLYNSLHHQALLINKSLHPEPPFDITFKIYADFDFNQRLYNSGASFVYSAEFFAVALPAGVSAATQLAELLTITRKNFGIFWTLTALLGYYTMRIFPVFRRLRPFRRLNDSSN